MHSKETGEKKPKIDWCSICSLETMNFAPHLEGKKPIKRKRDAAIDGGLTDLRLPAWQTHQQFSRRAQVQIHICQQNVCISGKDMSQSFGWSGNVKMLHIWRKSEGMTQSCKWMRWWNTTEPLWKSACTYQIRFVFPCIWECEQISQSRILTNCSRINKRSDFAMHFVGNSWTNGIQLFGPQFVSDPENNFCCGV